MLASEVKPALEYMSGIERSYLQLHDSAVLLAWAGACVTLLQ